MYRLNPFALPPETNGRFRLLVIAALIVIFITGQALALGPLQLEPASGSETEFMGAVELQQLLQDYVPFTMALLCLALGPGLVALLVSQIVYRRHAQRLQRRLSLEPLPTGKDTRFDQEMAQLTAALGLKRSPQIYIPKSSKGTEGQAFGLPPNYAMLLGGRMRLLLRKRPERFRAIVLHEMAHIVNGDIRRTYFTQALWLLTTFLILIPFMAFWVGASTLDVLRNLATLDVGLFMVELSLLVGVAFKFALLVLIFSLTRSSILRIREEYADWRAALHGGEQGLRQILEQTPKPRVLSILAAPWRLHPRAESRLKTLSTEQRLFTLRFDLPIITGFLIGFALVISEQIGFRFIFPVSVVWSSLARISIQEFMAASGPIRAGLALVFIPTLIGMFLLPFALVSYIGAQSIGVQLQRHAIGQLTLPKPTKKPSLRLAISATLFVVSVGFGLALVPFNPTIPIVADTLQTITTRPFVMVQIVVDQLIWMLVFLVVLGLWFGIGQVWSRWVLGRHQGESTPRLKRTILTLVQSVTLTLLLYPMLIGQALVYRQITSSGLAAAPVGGLLIIVLLVSTSAAIGGVYTLAVWLANGFNRPLICTACQAQTAHRIAVGHFCHECGEPLAPWAYVYL